MAVQGGQRRDDDAVDGTTLPPHPSSISRAAIVIVRAAKQWRRGTLLLSSPGCEAHHDAHTAAASLAFPCRVALPVRGGRQAANDGNGRDQQTDAIVVDVLEGPVYFTIPLPKHGPVALGTVPAGSLVFLAIEGGTPSDRSVVDFHTGAPVLDCGGATGRSADRSGGSGLPVMQPPPGGGGLDATAYAQGTLMAIAGGRYVVRLCPPETMTSGVAARVAESGRVVVALPHAVHLVGAVAENSSPHAPAAAGGVAVGAGDHVAARWRARERLAAAVSKRHLAEAAVRRMLDECEGNVAADGEVTARDVEGDPPDCPWRSTVRVELERAEAVGHAINRAAATVMPRHATVDKGGTLTVVAAGLGFESLTKRRANDPPAA